MLGPWAKCASEAISLARECDIPEVLPSAFYALSIQKFHTYGDGGRSHLVLSPHDLRRLIAGREALQDVLLKIVISPLCLAEGVGYEPCVDCATRLERYWRARLSPSYSSPWGCWLVKELNQMANGVDIILNQVVCVPCMSHHMTLAWERLKSLKMEIPRMFML